LPPDPNDYVTAVFDDGSRTVVMFGPADRTQPVRDEQVAHSGKASVRLGPRKGDAAPMAIIEFV